MSDAKLRECTNFFLDRLPVQYLFVQRPARGVAFKINAVPPKTIIEGASQTSNKILQDTH